MMTFSKVVYTNIMGKEVTLQRLFKLFRLDRYLLEHNATALVLNISNGNSL